MHYFNYDLFYCVALLEEPVTWDFHWYIYTVAIKSWILYANAAWLKEVYRCSECAITCIFVLQNEDVKSGGDLEPSRSKPKHSWKETTIFSHQKEAGQPPITKVFTHTGEGKHPKLSQNYANRDQGRNKLLSSHLERLLSDVPNTQQGNEKLHYINYIHPASSNQAESQVAFTSKSQRPNLDRLLFKASSNPPAAKEPLSAVDGKICLSHSDVQYNTEKYTHPLLT